VDPRTVAEEAAAALSAASEYVLEFRDRQPEFGAWTVWPPPPMAWGDWLCAALGVGVDCVAPTPWLAEITSWQDALPEFDPALGTPLISAGRILADAHWLMAWLGDAISWPTFDEEAVQAIVEARLVYAEFMRLVATWAYVFGRGRARLNAASEA
jgi:hypothetical protein